MVRWMTKRGAKRAGACIICTTPWLCLSASACETGTRSDKISMSLSGGQLHYLVNAQRSFATFDLGAATLVKS